jgi:serine palmitoyltransferase
LANGRTVTNLASYNFYNFVSNETLKERAIQTLRTYGVGPCGPPGFYGTQDVHMKIEADIAAFLGTTACIIYAQSFSTISSVIPAFSKRGDIIVADKAVNYAIRKGIQISRSAVRWYEHNDMEDLQRVLAKVTKEQAKKPLTRRFIITEGLFENTGEMADLPKIVSCRAFPDLEILLNEDIVDRAEAEVQIPTDPGRDMVIRCLRANRTWHHRTSTRRRRRSGHDHRGNGRSSLGGRRLLRRIR